MFVRNVHMHTKNNNNRKAPVTNNINTKHINHLDTTAQHRNTHKKQQEQQHASFIGKTRTKQMYTAEFSGQISGFIFV